MHLSSNSLSSVRKLVVQSVFIFVLLGSVVLPTAFSGWNTTAQHSKVRTEAVVLDVVPAPPSRSGKRRLWVEFEYYSANGTRHVRRRRVRTTRSVVPGQRITVRYSKRRPQYGRVVSLSPPPPKMMPTPSGTGTSLLHWLIGAIALPAMGYGVYLFLTGGNRVQRRSRQADAPPEQLSARRDPTGARRSRRTQAHVPTKVPYPPKHKSKVVQRAGWF